MDMAESSEELVTLGRVSGLFGVRGWIKVFSHTEPRESILEFEPWYLHLQGGWREMRVAEGQRHGKSVIARLDGMSDRDAAAVLVGADIAVHRDQMPALDEGEFYWSDLAGLQVVTVDGRDLGRVERLLETGANDVLVVQGERERLIPFLRPDVVTAVDLDGAVIRVDWDPDF